MASHGLDLDTAYAMRTFEVNTLISDSGVVQYNLEAPEWRIYNTEENPRWYFPNGLFAKNFDENLVTKATVKADTGYYYLKDEIWELVGHVHIREPEGTEFFAPRMFWNKNEAKIYSHDTVYILSPERQIHARNFRARQDMSSYTFTSARGDMLVEEEESESPKERPIEAPSDSL